MSLPDPVVIIIGAGASGLAIAACLTRLSIPYIILEREDCSASLWKKKSYDRLHLHLAKQYCQLPHFPFPTNFPKYVPKSQFIQYLDSYATHFDITPQFNRLVESARFDESIEKWRVVVRNIVGSGEAEEYSGRFLVVATGRESEEFVPVVEGLGGFTGEVMHSTGYKSGEKYRERRVLVVGCGNSGMEIAFDLAVHGAKTSIVVRSPIHILSKGLMNWAIELLKYLPFSTVESLVLLLSKLRYGGLAKYGIQRPKEGPLTMKKKYGKSPVVDIGTYNKIKSGEIQVLPAIARIKGDEVEFENGNSHQFDTIVFATGFKRSIHKWLTGDNCLLDEDGNPKPSFPNHWKGQNGLYCAGLDGRALHGAGLDAQDIANDIKSSL
ncbi:probable indole-3-pyruvate monooxygenase YUCCA10 [Rhododendron vialii]|uniref:probable indole-3-pyruvate monooxygenase YUCCA10 n=1 Tax=Rhododendron vialii TaxID=182163 RepID=UPI00266026A7|nr:probable indole-3-pyruvate monooxygenase YUCCA10 [Rhododendron vialii]